MPAGDEPPKRCPRKGCRGHVHKVFSPPAIIFKGSGFHVNDYSSTGPKSASAANNAAADRATTDKATADKATASGSNSDV